MFDGKSLYPKDSESGISKSDGFLSLSGGEQFYINIAEDKINMNLDTIFKDAHQLAPLAGGKRLVGSNVHDVALKVHKVVLADAINRTRPRLRRMIAALVEEHGMRAALHRDGELNYIKFYAPRIERQRQEKETLDRQIRNTRAVLAEYESFRNDCMAS